MAANGMDFRGNKNPNYKTGLAPSGGSRSSLYNSWQAMKQRCLNPNHPKYHRYGGRGIAVHKDWLTIEGFLKWAKASGHKEGLTIDRIDNNGNYCPENCQWVTASDNSKKKSTTKLSAYDARAIRIALEKGEKATALAKDYGVCHGTVWHIQKGITHREDVCQKQSNW